MRLYRYQTSPYIKQLVQAKHPKITGWYVWHITSRSEPNELGAIKLRGRRGGSTSSCRRLQRAAMPSLRMRNRLCIARVRLSLDDNPVGGDDHTVLVERMIGL